MCILFSATVCFFVFNWGHSTWLWSYHWVLVLPMQSEDGLRTRELGQSPLSSAPRCAWNQFSGLRTHGLHHRQSLIFDHYPRKGPSWRLSRNINWTEVSIKAGHQSLSRRDVEPYHGLATEAQLHGNVSARERFTAPPSGVFRLSCQPASQNRCSSVTHP